MSVGRKYVTYPQTYIPLYIYIVTTLRFRFKRENNQALCNICIMKENVRIFQMQFLIFFTTMMEIREFKVKNQTEYIKFHDSVETLLSYK